MNNQKLKPEFVKMMREFFLRFIQAFLIIVPMWVALYSISSHDEFNKFILIGVIVVLVNSAYSWLIGTRKLLQINSNWLMYSSAILLVMQTGHPTLATILAGIAFIAGIVLKSFYDTTVGISLLLFTLLV